MALNLSALSDSANKVTALGNLILVSPQKTVGYQPQNSPSWKRDTSAQPKAILFNYVGEEAVQLTAEVTDHPIENNTMVQDQVALKPVIFTVQGFVGELNDIAPAALEPLKEAAEKLTAISAYTPSLSTTAILAYTNAFQAYQVAQSTLNSAIETWSSINGGAGQSVINGGGLQIEPNQTQQQIYFQQFYGYFQNRTLFTVQTPWAIFQDMVIERLRVIQSAETRMISDFEIQFKLLRFASTQTVANNTLYDNNNFQGRAYNQGATEVDLGTNTLEPSGTSFSSLLA